MTSAVFSVLLLLQAAAPAANVRVTGRLTVEGGAQVPSSLILPLTLDGVGTVPALPPITNRGQIANRSLTIRPQIDGAFRVQLPPGEYQVGTPGQLPPGYTIQSITYGGVDLLRNPLKVAAGDSAELLISLAINGPSPAVSVSGIVTGLTPGHIRRIALREPGGGELSTAIEASIGADGAFTFPKVLPGRYIVYLRLRSVTPVTVGNQDVTGLIVAHPQDILVSGHVITEGGQTPPNTFVIEGNGKAPTMQNRGSGTFILSLENGENSISVRGIPETWQLKSMTYGEVDLQKQPLKLDGPANWDIVVRLAPRD